MEFGLDGSSESISLSSQLLSRLDSRAWPAFFGISSDASQTVRISCFCLTDERQKYLCWHTPVSDIVSHEGMGMPELREIDIEEAKRIAANRGLLPSRVRGTSTLRFSNGTNERLEIIDWTEFERILTRRELRIFESGGWMKLMKRRSLLP